SSIASLLDPQTQALLVGPLSFLTPVLVLLAVFLLLLRGFPWLLNMGATFAAHSRSAVPLLALAQMARTPRGSVRMLLILALAVAFGLFTLVFSASQAQRADDIATYQVGADFSGQISSNTSQFTLSQAITHYRQISGVTAATGGYVEEETTALSSFGISFPIRAIDPATFAQATLWTTQPSPQSLNSLLVQLTTGRQRAMNGGPIPAIVDSFTWNALNLHTGAIFTAYNENGTAQEAIHYIAIAQVPQLSSVKNSTEGGLLVDYESLAALRMQHHASFLAPNYIWLLTQDNENALTHVRTALNTPGLQLDSLVDRRALSDALRTDPLALTLLGLLALGSTTALLLAFASNLLTSWFSIRRHLNSFLVLRALGAARRQTIGVLLWEHGIVYAMALLLGSAGALFLALTIVPTLVFTSLPATSVMNVSSASDLYVLQAVVPTHLVLPWSLLIALLIFAGICLLALAMMIALALRTSISSTLRFEEEQSVEFLTREDSSLTQRSRSAEASRRTQTPSTVPTKRSLQPSLAMLAVWQLRRTWLLVLVQALGIIAAIAIICAVPLFSTVAANVGLRDVLYTSSACSPITLTTSVQGISSRSVAQVHQQLEPLVQQQLGAYLSQPAQFSLQSSGYTLLSPTAISANQATLHLVSTSISHVASQLTVVQGRLPKDTNGYGAIEAMLTPTAAQRLHIMVGSLLKLHNNFTTKPSKMFGGGPSTPETETLTVQIVGLFNNTSVNTSFGQGENVQPATQAAGNQPITYTLLTSNTAFLTALDHLAAASHGDTVFSPQTIALLRSRGARSSQIFGSLLLQSTLLVIIALLVGPLLAVLIVSFIAQSLLGTAGHDVATLMMDKPTSAVLQIGVYALGTALLLVVAIIFLLRRAVHTTILSMRRESARSTKRGFWQQLNLDVVAAIIAFTGYGISRYLTSISSLLDTRVTTLISAPLTLLAPTFLLIGALLLLMRFFPALLHLGTRLAMRGRGAVSPLALAQMARAPRQSMRMTILLALASAFAIFTLIFSASQAQHISAIAAYESGSDFSGDLATAAFPTDLQQETIRYQHIAGVTSTTVGYSGEGSSSETAIQLRAVDSSTFAQTAIWTEQDSSQPLSTLMAKLTAQRERGISIDVLPAIVDAATMQKLNLQIGYIFTINMPGLSDNSVDCLVIDEVQHIPTINSSSDINTAGSYDSPGGVLVDYSTYATIYKHNVLAQQASYSTPLDPRLPINHVWLRTSNTPTLFAHVRTALTTPGLLVHNLYDRRSLIDTMSTDPLYLSLSLILLIGGMTALLLTLVGNLMASWLNLRPRLTNLATLRAIGATSRQVMRVVLYEQAVVYATALLLGTAFGGLLSLTVVPNLLFTSIPASGILSSISSDEFYAIQRIIPAQLVVPPSLELALIGLVVICLLTFSMMTHIALQPSMNQTLRLNED
ncbi:MAG: ABC transporter permease, partial [Chloroflexota bacterium]|nr:ABC transporter permease [Chloroflexota bacterium]